MKIAVTGLSGLIGTRLNSLLKEKYELVGVSSEEVNIVDKEKLLVMLDSINPDLILHMAAKTNVDQCEEDKDRDFSKLKELGLYEGESFNLEKINYQDWLNDLSAFSVNVAGTKNIVDWGISNSKKIIYISTDFVFSGEDTPSDGYSEDDKTDPVDWYGMTKFLGEELVRKGEDNLVVRIAFPYGYKSEIKADLVWKLVELMKKGIELKLVSDQLITPTFIDDVVNGLDFLIQKNEKGLINLVGSSSLSSYQIGVLIADQLGFDKTKLGTIINEEFYKGRAKRPFKAVMKNDKLRNLGFAPKTFEEGLKTVLNT